MARTEKTATGVRVVIARDDDAGMIALEVIEALKLIGIESRAEFGYDEGVLSIDAKQG